MPQTKVIFYLLVGTCLYSSCLRISSIPLPEGESKLVINGLFQPDSTWKINVSMTGSTASDDEFLLPYVADARVEIREGEGDWLELSYSENGNYRSQTYPEVGTIYALRVFVEGHDTIRASSSIPSFPEDMEASWDLSQAVPMTDQWGGTFDGFRLPIRFTDPAGEQNYYQFFFSYHDSCICRVSRTLLDIYPDSIYIDPLYDELKLYALEDASLPDASYEDIRRVLMPDETFDGYPKELVLASADTNYIFRESMQIPLQTPVDSIENFQVRFHRQRLYIQAYLDAWSLSEDLYNYMISYYLQGFNTADPFATFNNVHNNIEGGLGIFAGYQRKLIQVYSD